MKQVPNIIFENDDFVAINKPAGMLSIPDRMQSEHSLKDFLINKYGNIFTVHRLDKETSGIILFAKNDAAHRYLSQQFENRETEKYYVGLVQGSIGKKEGIIEEAIIEHPVKKGLMTTAKKGKPSITEYKVLEEAGGFSLMEFRILTGRTHQIRVHMKFLGHPLACDELYGNGDPILLSSIKKKHFKRSMSEDSERPMLSRLGLHSYKLTFSDLEGKRLTLEAPVPKDIKALMTQLKKWKG
ncbi:MAG: RluA family pseudouridine synthase [Chitinophagaceae bacterium]|nr:RluA family pseudouridine synthase [Chitinophagaceae bacterium]